MIIFLLLLLLSGLFLDVINIYYLFNNKLVCRFSSKTHIPTYIGLYALYSVLSALISYIPEIPQKLFHRLLLAFLIFVIQRDQFTKRVFWIVIYWFIIIVCEATTIPFVMLITQTPMADIRDNVISLALLMFISRSLMLIVIKLLIHTNKRIVSNFKNVLFSIILVDVVYIIIMTSLFNYNHIYLNIDYAIAFCLLSGCAILMLTLYLVYKVTKKSDEIMMTSLKMQQIEMEHKQNQDMAIVVEDLRALRHDMNNHMSVLQGLLTMQEYDDARSYLSNITEELSVANSFIFTDNKVLSVMLNNKISKARQLGITFDTELLTSVTPFSDSDLCAVVGNIIENAIEASSKHEKPYILFSMKKSNNQLIIECENNYTVAPIFEKGNLITTKSDKAYHGIGTKTIRSVVEDYHGTTEFTVDDMFHVRVAVPM